MRKSVWLVPVLLLPSLSLGTARADWPAASRAALQKLSAGPVLFSDATVATLWGGTQARKTANSPLASNTELTVQNIKAPLLIQRSGTTVQRARLVVYLPGMFNNLNDPLLIRGYNRLARLGSHLLTLPNPWSEDYIRSGARTRPGDLEPETDLVLSVIRAAIQQIGPASVTGVDLVGDSDGAFLGAVTLARDAESAAPVITGSFTLFGPPLHFDRSLADMDRRIDAARDQYYRDCSGTLQLLQLLNDLMSAKSQASLKPATLNCAKPVFAFRAFQSFAVRAATALDETWHLGTIPTDSAARESWSRALTFESFLETYSPGGLAVIREPRLADLGYWLSRAAARRPLDLRILSSRDELVNAYDDWATDAYFRFDASNTRFVPWGGHLGWEALPEFDGLLGTLFN